MEELLKRAAELRGMPESLVERSAQARAKATGMTVEDVLRDWAGEAPGEVPEPAAPAETPPAPAAAVPAGTLSSAELLERAAEERGMPASLVERSAQARAKKEGIPIEEVLAEWAGVAVDSMAAAPRAGDPAPAAVAADPEERADNTDAEPRVTVLEPAAADGADASSEDPPAVRRSRYPIWLAAAFIVVPLIAVLYVLAVPTGPRCGSAGQLALDPVTGQAVNCDGTAYGVEAVNNFSAGQTIYEASCVACHGAAGGGGAGPALSGGVVLETFPEGSCLDHVLWVDVGTAGWDGPTYGAIDKPVGAFGVMPGFGFGFTEEELKQVSLYERVTFGGQAVPEAETDCGLTGESGDSAALGS